MYYVTTKHVNESHVGKHSFMTHRFVMSREDHAKRVLGEPLFNSVKDSHVLLVGAGGIGCELLKNLVMSGFQSIEVVDLDTIDVSNLNRQFLFQKQHIKKSKAHVAKETAMRFNPSARIVSYQANIKEPQFNVAWFKKFTIVLNALDNLDARRHVNQLCLAAGVPLIESGTTGYLGQAYVIKKDSTECFDCHPKPIPTTYPVCTIRSTPSAPIHCIVWAKSYLFSQLFGDLEEDEHLEEDISKENAGEVAALKREANELKEIKETQDIEEYTKKVFTKVFTSDIERLLSMKEMWKYRTPPTPLNYAVLEAERGNLSQTTTVEGDQKTLQQNTWSVDECFHFFKESIEKLSLRFRTLQETDPQGVLRFDKDDDDAMDFVTAAANLRAHIFGILQKSRFDVKSMAGNIIPAIATTNAIIAGVVVMKAFAILNNTTTSIKRTYLTTVDRRPHLFMLEEPAPPNPLCGVCRTISITLQVDLEHITLDHLVNELLLLSPEEGGAGLSEDIVIMDRNRMIYDIDLEENLELLLKNLGIRDGSILRISPEEGKEIDIIIQTR
ncbi:hypothetical protein BDF14DRAFT_1803219 [Spinellus fusiger]|nr:hypothetical protein BDF14DRAFT_1803219 [Spinellus fusiger]